MLSVVLRVLILLLISLNAWAEPGENTQYIDGKWQEYFEGSPDPRVFAQINRAEEEFPVYQWIKGYSTCKIEIDHLWSHLDRYEALWYEGRTEEATELFNQLAKERRKKERCHRELWLALLLKSSLLGPKINYEKVAIDKYNNYVERFRQRPPRGVEESINDHLYTDLRYELALVTLVLGNLGYLHELTDEKREELAGGNPEALITARDETGEYFTSAYFNCMHSEIYISSHLKPFNLAGTLSHEVDHLLRDKYFQENENYKLKSSQDYIQVDEILATLNSGFYQRRMLEVEKLAAETMWSASEFNLFSLDGPLNETVDQLYEESEELGSFPDNYSFLAYLTHEISRGDRFLQSKMCEIQNIILKGYFPNSLTIECNNPRENTTALGNKITRYQNIRYQFFNSSDEILRSLADARSPSGRLGTGLARRFVGMQRQEEIDDVLAFEILFLYFIEPFKKRLTETSEICQQVVDDQIKGNLKNYIGLDLFGKEEGPHPGSHPGNGGIRPCIRVAF